eukprot:TRINITY_DN1107_c0_g1_i2.p1 TRINITY_DN1107_c0_g1~~TRINITY_DN1107_c0_g1_i2.p1  ORF type:complete len:207 (+),score=79.98 TRINITY_DN1107_c0_g1_i2:140-760(+)
MSGLADLPQGMLKSLLASKLFNKDAGDHNDAAYSAQCKKDRDRRARKAKRDDAKRSKRDKREKRAKKHKKDHKKDKKRKRRKPLSANIPDSAGVPGFQSDSSSSSSDETSTDDSDQAPAGPRRVVASKRALLLAKPAGERRFKAVYNPGAVLGPQPTPPEAPNLGVGQLSKIQSEMLEAELRKKALDSLMTRIQGSAPTNMNRPGF